MLTLSVDRYHNKWIEWMGRRMDGWVDGWMNEWWIYGWMDGWMDGLI
jgi:hypothetical protein